MRAITYSRYGPPDVLQLTEVSRPVPKDDEVLVRVRAAEATKSDCEMRSFKYSVKWFWLPLRIALGVRKPRRQILGGYFSGEIESLGKDVTTFSVGDQVFGTAELRLGAYGEYVALPARYTIVAKPNNMSFAEAAAVPLGGLNALHFMRRAEIRAGEQVLINGAGGSIGFAEPADRLSFGYSMNRMGQGILLNDRGQSLVDAAYRILGYRSSESGVWAR